ncbi:MAG: hypothetical protein ACXWQO_01415 [Bdellovibrionota bacterium]
MGTLRQKHTPTLKSWAALALFCGIFLLLAQASAFASSDDDEDEGCPAADSAKHRLETANKELERAKLKGNSSTIDSAQRKVDSAEEKIATAEESCQKKEDRVQRDYKKCQKKMSNSATSGLYKWNEDKKVCEDQQAKNEKPNSNTGECNNAELMKGSLQGQNCKVAAEAVHDVKSRQEVAQQTALVATQAYSTMQAQQTTGTQQDVQQRQTNVLKGLAFMKLATGALAMSGAATLKSAASGAETASTNIDGAYKSLSDYCNQNGVVAQMTPEQCFYKMAPQSGVDPTQKNYATFERMRSGADQSKEQADKANEMAKQAMISGAADAAVGMQALYMARQTQAAANNFAPPPLPPGMAVPLGQMSGASGGTPGLGTGGPLPTGGTLAGDDGLTLGGNDGGQIKGGLIGGRPMAVNSYKAEKSSVSGGGGIGGGGGGGRGGGGGASRRGGGKGNTASGEYTNSGAGTGIGGGKTPGKDAVAGANPLADMMNKLFPPNEQGKPVVDARDPASAEKAEMADQADAPNVAVSELSIFEQVSTRYRSLNGAGQI